MKKESLLLALVLLASSAFALVRPDVRVTNYAVSPLLEPGTNAMLTLRLENVGKDDCAVRVIAQATGQYPIAVKGPDTIFIGDLCTSTGPRNVSFTLNADSDAVRGNNQVAVSITYDSKYAAQYSTSQFANVQIQGAPKLRAQITSLNPLDVHPGDTATVEVTLDNTGAAEAKAVKATLSADSPLEVKPGSSTAIIPLVGPKQSAKLAYAVFVPDGTKPADFPAKLQVSYSDQNAEAKTDSFTLYVHVEPKAKFSADGNLRSFFAGANLQSAKIALQNTGFAAAKKIRIKLIPQYPFSTDGSERYIERLEPGATSNPDFTVSIDKDATPGQYGLQLQAVYEDDKGRSFTDLVDVTMNVVQKDLFTTAVYDYWFIWAIAIIAIAVIVRSRLKKKLATAK